MADGDIKTPELRAGQDPTFQDSQVRLQSHHLRNKQLTTS